MVLEWDRPITQRCRLVVIATTGEHVEERDATVDDLLAAGWMLQSAADGTSDELNQLVDEERRLRQTAEADLLRAQADRESLSEALTRKDRELEMVRAARDEERRLRQAAERERDEARAELVACMDRAGKDVGMLQRALAAERATIERVRQCPRHLMSWDGRPTLAVSVDDLDAALAGPTEARGGVRAEALEEAARVCESLAETCDDDEMAGMASDCAAAIRVLTQGNP